MRGRESTPISGRKTITTAFSDKRSHHFMEYLAHQPFDGDFWSFVENFSSVPSYYRRFVTFERLDKSSSCHCCGSRGGVLKGKTKNCVSCGLEFCSSCMDPEGDCFCYFCSMLQKRPREFPRAPKVVEWMNKHVKMETCTPIQCSVYFFAHLLESSNDKLHAYALYALHKYQNVYLQADNIDFLVEFLAKHVSTCCCDERALSIDLYCNVVLTRRRADLDWKLDYRDVEPLLSSRNKNLDVVRAACRLFFLLAEKGKVTADQNEVVNALHTGEKEAVAYLVAALAVQCEIPDMYEIHHPQLQEAKYQHMQKMVYGLVKLFDPASERTSVAAKYFGSMLLFRVSQTIEGMKLLSGHIPSATMADAVIRYCPHEHEMEKHKARIAVFLAATYLNMWIFSGEKKTKLRALLFQDIMTFVVPICEIQQGYNEYSYLGILQTLALELIKVCSRDANCGIAFKSEQFRMMVERMQKDRELVSEKRIGEYKVMKQEHLDLLQKTQADSGSDWERPPLEEEEAPEQQPPEGQAEALPAPENEPAAEEEAASEVLDDHEVPEDDDPDAA